MNPVELLQIFVSPKDTMRPQFCTPYEREDGWVYATNQHIAIRIKKEKVGVDFPTTYSENRAYPKCPIPDESYNTTITLDALKEAMNELPEIEEVVKCSDCGGFGRVEWQYEADDGEMYYHDFVCPVCNGNGDLGKTGKKVKDPGFYFSIEGMVYCQKAIIPLIKAMEMLNIESIVSVARSCGCLLLTVGDYIEIIMAGGIALAEKKVIKVQ